MSHEAAMTNLYAIPPKEKSCTQNAAMSTVNAQEQLLLPGVTDSCCCQASLTGHCRYETPCPAKCSTTCDSIAGRLVHHWSFARLAAAARQSAMLRSSSWSKRDPLPPPGRDTWQERSPRGGWMSFRARFTSQLALTQPRHPPPTLYPIPLQNAQVPEDRQTTL